jgi:hypothetical protein
VDESFRAGTRAGLTRARSLNTWFIQNQRSKKLTSLLPPAGGRIRSKGIFIACLRQGFCIRKTR